MQEKVVVTLKLKLSDTFANVTNHQQKEGTQDITQQLYKQNSRYQFFCYKVVQ